MQEAEQVISYSPVMASIPAAKQMLPQGLDVPISQCGVLCGGEVQIIDQAAIKFAFQMAKTTVLQHEEKSEAE